MLPAGATAFLQIVSSHNALATAISGTVTVSRIDSHSVAGVGDVATT
jgi:hypothetical protein